MSSLSGMRAPSRRGLLSVLGPIDWRLLFNVSQRTQPNLSLQPTSARLTPWRFS